MENFKQLIAADMGAVDQVIRTRLHSEVLLINQVGEYIINSGGKRLRPALVILSADAFGYRGKYHHDLAAVVEFIHTATLLHDDVVDESSLRRGQATVNAVWGNAPSVLVGDFLISRSFQMVVNVGNMKILRILSEATNLIAEGEVLQLINCKNPDTTEQQYMEVIRYKTAKMFEASAQSGAVLANPGTEMELAFARYADHLGCAFQLIDDVLDYTGSADEMGKNVGDDLAEGKPTLPLIFALQHGKEADRALIRKAINTGGLDELDAITRAVRDCGALDYTIEQAQEQSRLAKACLAAVPDNLHKQAMLALCDLAVARNH